MNQKEAYQKGKDIGTSIANASFDDTNWLMSQEDDFTSDIYDRKDNYQSYSPWEFFAKEVNDSGDRAENLWDQYENGFAMGAKKVFKVRTQVTKLIDYLISTSTETA